MNNYYIIRVRGYISRFIRKCMSHDISIYNIDYLDEDTINVKIDIKDYKKVRRLNYYSRIKIINYEGINGVKRHFKNNMYIYIIVLLCFALMDVITSYIIRIDIIHENSTIRSLVTKELEANGIKPYSLSRSFDDLEDIKNKILEDNPTKLEWMSITRVGMIYVIRIEERIITDTSKDDGYAHIISEKDALITKITSNKGDVLVRSGDYVKKGDILISGEIKLYEEVKANTLATGEVYGNVWYTSDILFPMEYEEKKYTDNERFNITINNKILFKNKYQYFEQKKVRQIKILGLKISFYKEVEYTLIKKKYSASVAEKLALEKLETEFIKKLYNKGTIISKKVLKKELGYSTISISVFIVTNELISTRQFYTLGSDMDDSSNSD